MLADGRKSSLAAEKGVLFTTMTRLLLPIPIFLVPPLILISPPVAAFCVANPSLSVPISTLLLMIGFGFGLPASIALFPSTLEISVDQLEPEFQRLVDKDSSPIKTVYFYRGL